MILHGRKDQIITLPSSQRPAQLIPHAQFIQYEAGHAPFYDVAEAFNRQTVAFVQALASQPWA